MFKIKRLTILLAPAVLVCWAACREDVGVNPTSEPVPLETEGIEGAASFDWAIGPIEGITSVWHPAPREITVPVGTTLRLKCGSPADGDFHWVNAREIERVTFGSIAEFSVDHVGRFEIRVEAGAGEGGGGTGGKKGQPGGASSTLHECVVNGVDVPIKDIGVREFRAWVDPLILTESASNYETMNAFFGKPYEIVSRFREVKPGVYRTSVKRHIRFDAIAADSRFGSLIEARVPGRRPQLVASFDASFDAPGTHIVSVGPTSNPKSVVIEMYETVITSHESFETIVPEKEPITFTAKTNPPGFEKEITWVSSTMFGKATPVLGKGPSFTVRFEDTWGTHPETGEPFQWLGARADNATFDQDQKGCVFVGQALPAPVITNVTPNTGSEGTIVTVTGSNFGTNPDNLCALLCLGDELVGCRVLSTTGTSAQVQIGFPRPGLYGVPMSFMMARALGGPCPILEPGVTMPAPWVWGFDSNLDVAPATAPNPWTPVAPSQAASAALPLVCTTLYASQQSPATCGPLEVTIDFSAFPGGVLPAGTEVEIQARIGVFGRMGDAQVKPTFTVAGDEFEVADTIGRILRTLYLHHVDRRLRIRYEVIADDGPAPPPVCGLNPGGPVYLQIEVVNAVMTSGGIQICVK